FGRCDLKADDRKGAALWLWEVHNDVTLRVSAESSKPMPELWPSASHCPHCWPSTSVGKQGESQNYNATAVSDHLRSEYWGRTWDSRQSQSQRISGPWAQMIGGSGGWPVAALGFILVAGGLLLAGYMVTSLVSGKWPSLALLISSRKSTKAF
ncbi:unnamed protein product, partial [Polarella glacialis]